MKKWLLLSGFVCMRLFVSAQAYQPFDTTTVWNTLYTRYGPLNPCNGDSVHRYFVKGYLVNNGLTWHNVYVNSFLTDRFTPIGSGPCNALPPTRFAGMFHNDMVNKRVYFVPSATLSPGFIPGNSNLIFDFKKNLNDTISVYNGSNPTYKMLSYKIIGIDSILFENKYHKRFKGTTTEPFNNRPPYVHFIEGIGSTAGVFHAMFSFYGAGAVETPLLCFSGISESKLILFLKLSGFYSASTTGIKDTTSCNWLTTGIPEYSSSKNSQFSLYPNPADEQVMIDASDALQPGLINSCVIYNSLGQVLREEALELKDNRAIVNTEQLPEGIYTLLLKGKGAGSYRKQLVISR